MHTGTDQAHHLDGSSLGNARRPSHLAASDEETDSGSDGDSRESDDEGRIPDTMPDNKVPATAVGVLLNNACRGIKLASMAQVQLQFNHRRQASRQRVGAAKRAHTSITDTPAFSYQFILQLWHKMVSECPFA